VEGFDAELCRAAHRAASTRSGVPASGWRARGPSCCFRLGGSGRRSASMPTGCGRSSVWGRRAAGPACREAVASRCAPAQARTLGCSRDRGRSRGSGSLTAAMAPCAGESGLRCSIRRGVPLPSRGRGFAVERDRRQAVPHPPDSARPFPNPNTALSSWLSRARHTGDQRPFRLRAGKQK
jgi:hypothetical protein